jgi:hypothetical protein
MKEDLPPKVFLCTSEIPQSVNAGSMQLFRAPKGYPGNRLLVMGPPPDLDAELLPCRYERLKLLTYRLACTRFRRWASGLNALNTLMEPKLGRSVKLAREFAKIRWMRETWAFRSSWT